MAIICRKHKLLFIMSPRTACTAIGALLCEQHGGEFIPAEDILDGRGMIAVQKKHSTLTELINRKILAREEAKSLLKVAAVRNPFDSLVSLYFKQRLKYQPLLADPNSWVNRSPRYAEYMRYAQTHSFGRWILKTCYRKAIKRLLGFRPSMYADYTQGVDMVLRYEQINEDLSAVFRKAGITSRADIPVVNRTDERAKGDYRSFYSRGSAFVAGFAYECDLKTYGYQF
jgi:Sulfotransferase family